MAESLRGFLKPEMSSSSVEACVGRNSVWRLDIGILLWDPRLAEVPVVESSAFCKDITSYQRWTIIFHGYRPMYLPLLFLAT